MTKAGGTPASAGRADPRTRRPSPEVALWFRPCRVRGKVMMVRAERRAAKAMLRHAVSRTVCRYPVTRLYCNDLANAWPRLAFEVCAPAQNGTAVSAKALCESQTSLKKAFSAAFFSSDALAAFM